jgi:hypothetical protein
MQNFQLGDYRGGRDTLNEAMQMQYSPLEHIQAAAQAFGQQGMSGANAIKRQRMEQQFLGQMEDTKFGHEMDKLGTEYDRRLQEQEARYDYESQIHHQDQMDLYNRETESDLRKTNEAERLRLLQESHDMEAMGGGNDFTLNLYKTLASGYDPESKEGKLYNGFVKTLEEQMNSGSPYRRAGATKAFIAAGLPDPTIASAMLGANVEATNKVQRQQEMKNQKEAPAQKDEHGLDGTDKDFHWTKPKTTTPAKK